MITSEHRLVLTNYEEITNASERFVIEPRLAETTHVIVIEETREAIDVENKFRAVTTILTECSKHQVLKAFKWKAPHDSSTRPAEFWEALTKIAPSLQHLSISFHTHELHRMAKTGVSATFPSTFPLLKSLYIDCIGAHGDDGSPIEKLLHGLPNLRSLHIDAPNCDLENCRIKGLTWTYKFPRLTHFALSMYYNSKQEIASFLANHPTIRAIIFDADGDEPIPNVSSLLPDLEALSMWGVGYTLFGDTELLTTNPQRKIAYLKTGVFPQYDIIPQYAPSLRCLELHLYIEDVRNEQSDENNAYHRTKALLALLPELSELAIHFSSGWTTTCIADGISRKALPMDEEILSKIIAALPTSSNLQVLRMKDRDNGNGSPLSVESGIFASLRERLPSRLKLLQWEIKNSTLRYELGPEGSVRIVDPPEHRQWPDTVLWTDESILNHLQS